MTSTVAYPEHEDVAGPVLLWTAAALLAVAGHGGSVLWMLRLPPADQIAEAAPAAIMIELAPEPVAPSEDEDEIAPDPVDVAESAAPEVRPEPEMPPLPEPAPVTLPLHEPILPPPPEPDPPALPVPEPVLPQPAEPPVAEPDLPPPPEPAPPELRKPPEVEVVDLPRVRPIPRPPRVAERTPEQTPERPRDTPPPPQSQAAVRARVQAPPAEAAPATSAGRTGSISPARWQSRLMAHLERHKRYPPSARKRREEGTAQVHFSIDERGNVRSVRLLRSSGHAELDEAVIAMVRNASPVPAPPPGAPRDITAPVQFQIR